MEAKHTIEGSVAPRRGYCRTHGAKACQGRGSIRVLQRHGRLSHLAQVLTLVAPAAKLFANVAARRGTNEGLMA